MGSKDKEILLKIMSHRIVHGYEGVDLRIVWDTVKEDLPSLEKGLKGDCLAKRTSVWMSFYIVQEKG
ncbi:MAG: DUF86 domain-containing protein [Lachnospiraceae bacterium]|nr:DUF86 domain-containing protein [Lachnospiraceae bacterium]